MNKTGFPVSWRGQTLYLSERTDKVKQGFCAWVANRMCDNARKGMRADHYYAFERSVWAHMPEWTTIPDPEVVTAFGEADAGVQLVRLHLEATVEEMPDDEIKELLAAKESDPDSDYSRAMKRIKESANPKASGASSGSRAPTDASEPKPNCAGSATSS